AELYQREGTFRRVVDRCCELLKPHLKMDLRSLLLASPEDAAAARRLEKTRFAQPALFTVEVALAELWKEWLGRPQALLGHSIGEYVAACVAGTLSLEDGLRLVAARGRLMQALPPGAMLSVPLGEEELEQVLGTGSHLAGLELAVVNGPRSTVVSGPGASIAGLEERLREAGHASRRLRTSHAFHSAMMEPILEDFRGVLDAVRLESPRIPFVSNLTGQWIKPEEAVDPDYWVRHLRHTVRFSEGLERLLDEGSPALVEVGPGRALSALVRQHRPRWPVTASLPGGRQATGELESLLTGLGELWKAGVDVDWEGFYGPERRRRVLLPTYPFQRQRYLVEPSEAPGAAARPPRGVSESFYVPAWRRRPLPSRSAEPSHWLLVRSRGGVAESLAEELAQALRRRGEPVHVEEPRRRSAWAEVLAGKAAEVDKVLFLDSLEEGNQDLLDNEAFLAAQERFLYPFLELAQAVAEAPGRMEKPVDLALLGTGLVRLDGRDAAEPGKAPLLALAKALQQEHSSVACRCLDLDPWAAGLPATVRRVLGELSSEPRDGVLVAYRGGERWVEEIEPTSLGAPAAAPAAAVLRPRAVVMITGGLGGIGLVLAEALATAVQARLVLVGRSPFPPVSEWQDWLEEHGKEDPTSRKILQLQAIEEKGGEVFVGRADVADESALSRLVDEVAEVFGPLDGVIHGAGVVGEKAAAPFLSLDRGNFEEQFRPKALGLQTLVRVLESRAADRPLPFLVVTSSTAAVLGGIYFGAYAAANLYADV
ncbi:MAG: SDR family NAD(P)-dependent oxidoreductase, partial [Acidobacteria bacterium]|nr:SDR family NAD(P)-dependent oxidoreductase [Acidobacteriota bacterium]